MQTLPRLNRAHAQNHDVFLDFMNDTDTIQAVFATAPVRPGLSEEERATLLETIDMDSYRVEKWAAMLNRPRWRNANSVTSTGSPRRTGCGASSRRTSRESGGG